MNNPEYVQIDGIKAKINTDFRYAIECERIAKDTNISNYEKQIGIIYTLFDIDNTNIHIDYEKWLKVALKYLLGRNSEEKINKPIKKTKKDMDYNKDWGLIVSSMWSTYNIDITKEKIHWWTFFDLLNGLPSDCIFNKVRDIRNKDISKIKDRETREQYIELKKAYSLEEETTLTKEQEESVKRFYELTGIERK